jgi:hypothetical protein
MVNRLDCWMIDTDVLWKMEIWPTKLQFYCFLCSPNFCHLVTDKIIQCDLYKGFLWKNAPKLLDIEDFTQKKIPWNCHIWTMGSSRLPKYNRILKFFYFPLWIGSLIWLIPLVDDLQCSYITKLGKINPTTKLVRALVTSPCHVEEARVWTGEHCEPTQQHTLQDGWYVDRNCFLVELLSNNK